MNSETALISVVLQMHENGNFRRSLCVPEVEFTD